MKAIQYTKSIPRYLVMCHLGKRWRNLYTSSVSCMHLVDMPEPQLPTPEWVKVRTRLSGICGSDLAIITAKGSPYFSPFTSTPFVLGHEIIGEIAETGATVEGFPVGARVVIEPALSCKVRGISPPCHQCRNQRLRQLRKYHKRRHLCGGSNRLLPRYRGWMERIRSCSPITTPPRSGRYLGRNRCTA